jgi:orotate phosphoribosyltransferase
VVVLSGDLTSGRAALADALFRIGALRFGKFALASGRTSTYYVDLRVVPSEPETFALAVQAYLTMAREIGEENFDVVAGVATAGVTVSSVLAYLLKKPMVYVRREDKGHGLGKTVEGAIRPRWRALVVDDLVTTGGSIVSAVQALRGAGCVVKESVVLVDRLEGGEENLAANGVRLSSFVDIRELGGILLEGGKVTKGDYEAMMKQTGGRGRA